MKTDKYFIEFNEFKQQHLEMKENLDTKLEQEKLKNDQLHKEYKQLVTGNKEDEAQTKFEEISKNNKEIEEIKNRLNITQQVYIDNYNNKTYELIAKHKEITEDYSKDLEPYKQELIEVIEKYNKCVDEIDNINKQYRSDMYKLTNAYNGLNSDEKKEYSRKFGHFSTFAVDLFNLHEIKIDIRDKKLKGVK